MDTLDMTFDDEKEQAALSPENDETGNDAAEATPPSSAVQTAEAPTVPETAPPSAGDTDEEGGAAKKAVEEDDEFGEDEFDDEDEDEEEEAEVTAPHAGLAPGVTLKDPAHATAPLGKKAADAAAKAEKEAARKEPKKARVARKRWYIVHTYSGHENKVKVNLERRIESMGMGEKIFRVEVPQKTVTKIKENRRFEKEERIFPGYVLVEMIMDDDSWYVVRHTPGVTKFVGSQKKPIPAKDAEIKRILMRNAPVAGGAAAHRVEIDLKVGEVVKIISGPFADFEGTVTEVSPEKERLKASVSIFGRETPVELAFNQVVKAD